jgi:hypothetical protein
MATRMQKLSLPARTGGVRATGEMGAAAARAKRGKKVRDLIFLGSEATRRARRAMECVADVMKIQVRACVCVQWGTKERGGVAE